MKNTTIILLLQLPPHCFPWAGTRACLDLHSCLLPVHGCPLREQHDLGHHCYRAESPQTHVLFPLHALSC